MAALPVVLVMVACSGQARPARHEAAHYTPVATAYLRIVGPANKVTEALDDAYGNRVPFARYVADAHAEVKAMRRMSRQLRAARWPASVQPSITALAVTYSRAIIRCMRAEIHAGSYAGVGRADRGCKARKAGKVARKAADTIRARLGLPTLF